MCSLPGLQSAAISLSTDTVLQSVLYISSLLAVSILPDDMPFIASKCQNSKKKYYSKHAGSEKSLPKHLLVGL